MSEILEKKPAMKFINLDKLPTIDIFLKKCFIMSYAGIVSFFVTLFIAKWLHYNIAKKYDKNKSVAENIINLLTIIISMLISYYCIRQIMEIIPYPFHNPPDFDVYRIREIKGTVILAFAYYIYLKDDLLSYKDLLIQISS